MRRERPKIVLLVTVICVLCGILVGLSGVIPPAATETAQSATPSRPPVTPTRPGQISILLLGVESLTAPAPRLEACWVLTFEPGIAEYFLIGFSPASWVTLPGETQARQLGDIFAGDRKIQTSQSLFTRDAVIALSPGLRRPDAEMVYDREVMATAIDMLGGVALGEERLNGADLLARFARLPTDDDAGRLVLQRDVLSALSLSAQKRIWTFGSAEAYFHLGQQWRPGLEWFTELARQQLPATDMRFDIVVAPLEAGATRTPVP